MGKRIFKYDPDRFDELRKIMLTRSIPVSTLAIAVGLYLGLSQGQPQQGPNVTLIALPLSIVLALLAGGFGLMRAVKRQRGLYDSYRLLIDDDSISREQLNTPSVRIMKSDISLIAKNKNGSITIKGKDNREVIGIGSQIEGYDELEAVLRQIKPLGGRDQRSFLERYGKLSGVATIILMGAVFLSEDAITVILCGAVLLGLFGWSFLEVQRSKHIDAKTKRSMYVAIFPVFAVLAKIAFLWL